MVDSFLNRQSAADRHRLGRRPRATTSRRWAIVLPLLLGLVAGACELNVRAGRKPDIDALESKLQIGSSTRETVRAAMGEPFGRGRSMFPFHDAPRDVWTYYYEEGNLEDDRRTFLYIFFDENLYDGYIWFSSLPR